MRKENLVGLKESVLGASSAGGASGSVRAGDFRKLNVLEGTSPLTSVGYSVSAVGEVLEDGTSSVALDLEKKPLEPDSVR